MTQKGIDKNMIQRSHSRSHTATSEIPRPFLTGQAQFTNIPRNDNKKNAMPRS